MIRTAWDETWHAVATAMAKRSLCVRDQVGAVIVDARNRIIATGYNGPPEGFQHESKPCSEWCMRAINASWALQPATSAPPLQRDYSDCPALHAEANALSVCDRSVREGGTIYVTSHVCFACAKLIANSGLSELYVYPTIPAAHRNSHLTYDFLDKCGITVYHGIG